MSLPLSHCCKLGKKVHFICGAEGTYKPAPAVSGHVTVDLYTLAWVSVDVDGVDAAQGLAIQQVLGTVLRGGEQTVSCLGGGGRGMVRRCSCSETREQLKRSCVAAFARVPFHLRFSSFCLLRRRQLAPGLVQGALKHCCLLTPKRWMKWCVCGLT